jgi:hypothetical protein
MPKKSTKKNVILALQTLENLVCNTKLFVVLLKISLILGETN